ncbi:MULTISPECIES: translation initiation factor 2 [Pseudomonas]|uniref:Translation initiation factor 2 n=1 Tax=Pseudomonas quercus TaxID=2722792 RepID=A0ABX0YAV1_9PSED|nr:MULTISPECIES: translation initiation factor 2 [Pseudomonas]MBF7140869.1 translation initiation factor 2 [Pseudomonas sp. LY10J]NJO99403.1 translation initiation factor 2 [Pseudomonas quercus]
MNHFKCLLGLSCVLVTSLIAGPAPAATPEPFVLGAPVPLPATIPAAPKTGAKRPGATLKAAAKASPKKASKAAAKASKRTGRVAAKSRSRKSSDAIASDIPPAKIDLTLPKDMVNQLQPPGKPTAAKPAQASVDGKPLLPSLFNDKSSAEPFELNGRLLTNEMDLQLRNERRDVEGAALDFKFKQ